MLRRHSLNGSITEERARAALADLADLRLVCHPPAPLRERVWALRHNLTTGDGGLAAVARIALGEHAVHETV